MEVREPDAKYLAKPAYKQTEVGVIPNDWLVKTLGELAQIQTGNTPSTTDSSNYGDEFLFVSPADMGATKYIFRSQRMLSKKGFSKSRLFPADSILFVCIGSTIGKAGIAARALTSNQQVNAILPTTGNSPNFLYYAITAAAPRIRALAGEQAVPIVNKSQFSETEIALPPTKFEQYAIAEVLSDADALIESLEQLLAKKRQIKQSAMQELLSGQERLPGFAKAWSAGDLNDVIDSLVAGVSVNSDDTEPIIGTPCVLKTSALSGGRFLPSECKSITRVDWRRAQTSPRKNSILISRMNTPDLVGEVGYVADDHPWLFLPDRIWMTRLRTNAHTNVQWLCYMLSSPAYKRQIKDTATGTSGSMKNISKDALLSLPILFPTEEEQTAIATLLSDMDAEIAALEAKLTKARDLKQGMMQELLTGRIRLV